MAGPLADVRVIDLTHALAGPYGTMLLADMGADVVKVESGSGDLARGLGPFHDDDELRAYGGYFQSVNRGKRSICLDLKTEDGRRQLLSLVREADVLVENFSAGVMSRFGLGWSDLHAANPRLVYATLRGFGDSEGNSSPYVEWPAFDVAVQAFAGALSITGQEDGTPVKIGPGVADIFPGALLSLGIVSAVLEARTTGKGQHVDVAMYDAVLSLCERIVHQYSYTGTAPRPSGNSHPILSPFDVLRAEDGWVAIAAVGDGQWRELCELMGRLDLRDDASLASVAGRKSKSDLVRSAIESWTSKHTKAELGAILGGRVPFGPVNDARDIFEDPHAKARNMLVSLEHPGSSKPAVVAGTPIKFSNWSDVLTRRAPLLDEHGASISERGFADEMTTT